MNFQLPIIFSCPVSWARAIHPTSHITLTLLDVTIKLSALRFFLGQCLCCLLLVLGQHSPFVCFHKNVLEEKWKNPGRQSKLCVRLECRRGQQENIVVICEDWDEIYSRWAEHRDLVCLHSSVWSTERNRAEHFCTAQQSVCLHWLRPAGALLCGNPMSTFHTCAPHGWMGLLSQAVHLWAFSPPPLWERSTQQAFFHAWLPVVTAVSFNADRLSCLSFFATVRAAWHLLLLMTDETRRKTFCDSWNFVFSIINISK